MKKIALHMITCPVCHTKTQVSVSKETILLHFPLYCQHCQTTTFINMAQLRMTVENPEAFIEDIEDDPRSK